VTANGGTGMLGAVPSTGATVTTPVDDRAPAPRRAQVSDLRPDLVRLALVVVVDVLFLFGVLLTYLNDGWYGAEWVANVFILPVTLTVFFLPWVTVGSAGFSGYRLWRGGPLTPVARAVCLSVVVLGAAGFVTYITPWGVDAIRWLLDSD